MLDLQVKLSAIQEHTVIGDIEARLVGVVFVILFTIFMAKNAAFRKISPDS